LPDNLKKLFRSVAMTQPDKDKICEVLLFSQGFAGAEKLATKLVLFFGMCGEQLSHESHYDFGLRALKSVLTHAGRLRRGSGAGELDIVVESIRQSVAPKLVSADAATFERCLY
jgi:dynein heavy chain 1